MGQHEIGQCLNGVVVSPVPTRHTGKAFMRVFIENVRKTDLSAIAGSIFYKIAALNMILMFRSQTDAAVICQPEPAFFYLFFRQFQTFFPPDTFDSFVTDSDPFVLKHTGTHPIPDPAIIGGQVDDLCADFVFIAASHGFVSAGVAVDS